jgi:SsrA-binding protein
VKPSERKTLIRNRKARFLYVIDESLETGIVLLGSEVKSLREGAATLTDAFAEIRSGELWLLQVDIQKYPWANQFNHEPRRDRKLLAKKQEIHRLEIKVREKGYTLVPLEIYLKNGKIKVDLGLAKGRSQVDKRQRKREEEARRELRDRD